MRILPRRREDGRPCFTSRQQPSGKELRTLKRHTAVILKGEQMDTSQEHDRSQDTTFDDRDNSAALVGMVAAALSGAVVGLFFGGYFALSFVLPGLPSC